MSDLKKLRGLTAAEVETSRKTHGANLLTPPEKASLWSQFVEKFNDPLIKILLVALVLSIGISCYEVMALGSLPVNCLTLSCTAGIRVEPPTKST